jgi:hypothetical protein
MKTAPHRKVYWIPLPDPIKEEEVNLVLGDWTADARTTRALERQAALMGFESPVAYLQQLIASTLAGNEEDTYIGPNGQLVSGCDIDRP